MSPVDLEQIKLFANACDRLSTACFTVGLLTPIAGYIYDVSGFRSSIGLWHLLGGLTCWIIVGIGLHLLARRALNRIGS